MVLQNSFLPQQSSGLGTPQQPQTNSTLDATSLATSHFWGRSATDKNIVFIDTAVKDYQQLAAGVISGDKVVLLDPKQNEVAQITHFLATEKGVQSIHIVSHGSAGSLQLGNTQLNLNNLTSYNQDLGYWRTALAPGGDILLYGCDVASGTGIAFVQQLAALTGANVEASIDLTGSAALGGNWQLEYSTSGKSDAALAFTPQEMQSYRGVLATFLRQFGSTGSGNGQFQVTNGIALDAKGNIYVADDSNNRVQVFNPDGTYNSQFSTSGSGSASLISPFGVAFDANGNIYVVSNGNNHIDVFNPDGTYKLEFGTSGSGDGQFNYPTGIGLDANGNIYVGDRNEHIQVFNPDGTYKSKFGTSGSGDGQFKYVQAVALDAKGNIYTADAGNNRIEVFNPDGTYKSKFGTFGSGDGQFNSPQALAFDANGNIYVVDGGNNRIEVFNPDGTYKSQFGTSGSGDGQFNSSQGVALDAKGNIYVADAGNNRIEVFSPKNITTTTSTSDNTTTVFGQAIAFTATVTSPNGGTPTGKVNFLDNGQIIGTEILDSKGTSSFSTSSLTAGSHNITEAYLGDGNFNSSGTTNNPLAETVNPGTTTTTATASTKSIFAGQNLTFTLHITANAPSTGTPTGKVNFLDNGQIIDTEMFDSQGTASFTTSTLTVGSHKITEAYLGDGNFSSSSSDVITETITKAKTPSFFSFADYLELQVDKGQNLVNELFDNSYYLAHNLDVATAVAKGQFKSGLDHFLQFGQFEGRDPSVLFSNSLYLAENADVAKEVASGQVKSGFVDFVNSGLKAHRDLRMLSFDEGYYLANNSDVKAAVNQGNFHSGFEHYLEYGQQEGRNPSSIFNETYYLAQNPDIKAAVVKGTLASGFDHFTHYGIFEGRNPSASFSNSDYLTNNPDVATGVTNGVVKSGFEHALRFGEFEGRAIQSSVFDEAYYLANNPDVAAAVNKGLFASGFDHFVLYGQAEKRRPSTNYDETYYLATNPDIEKSVKSGAFKSGFEHFVEYGMAEGRVSVG